MTTRVCLQMYLLFIQDNYSVLIGVGGKENTTAPFLVQRKFCSYKWRFTSSAKGDLAVFIYGKESSYDG